MKARRWILRSALLTLVLCAAVSTGASRSIQDVPKTPAQKPAVAAAPKEVHPAFLTPREKSGAYVFLAWTWLGIGFLLYFLRLKVREADRVHSIGLYKDQNGQKEPPVRL